MKRRARGFTLIELLVVLAVLGVLAAAIMPLGETLVRSQKERQLREALWEIRGAIDEYKKVSNARTVDVSEGQSGYPPSLKALVEGVPDTRPQTLGQTLYFLRRVPRDPFADSAMPADLTWKLRSYASPPDKPLPGEDVFDVRSASDAVALDGSSYSSW